jgi:hypothetical protein
VKLKAADDTFPLYRTCADTVKSTREKPAQRLVLKIISRMIKLLHLSTCTKIGGHLSIVTVSGHLDTSRKVGRKVERHFYPFCFQVLRYPFCELISTMREIDCFLILRLRYAVLDEYLVLILSLRAPPWFWTAIWEWESTGGCFYRRSGRLANTSIWRGLCAGMVMYY